LNKLKIRLHLRRLLHKNARNSDSVCTYLDLLG
jgi:hypothetical protein